uniref:Large ribosomal subunit protein mL43 n=1 Tax=Cacopsylla melanoneura TaxID=428564 RepID=A0A8D9BW21_9HEMI
MSKSHLYLRTGFPRAPLANGLGRYMCQVKRMTVKFCKSHGSSRGVRDFIETDMIDFVKQSPEFVLYLKPRRHHSPHLIAEYLNGERFHMSFHNFNREEITKWLNLMKTRAGAPIMAYRKLWHTNNPSIQGVWSPFVNQDTSLNITSFPNDKLSRMIQTEPTATELLLEMFKKQQLEDSEANVSKGEGNRKEESK